MAPVAPVPAASTVVAPILVTTVMPLSVPATAVLDRVTPENVTVMTPAVRGAVPFNTKLPSLRVSTLYPAVIKAPSADKTGAAVQPEAAWLVKVKKPAGQPIVIEFMVEAHPTVAWGKLVAVVKVNTGVTSVEILRLALGMVMETAVTIGGAVPTDPESAHTVV